MSESPAPRRTNRRLTARTACQLTVRYQATGVWRPATAMDLSRHGCRLRLGEDLGRHATVSVSFESTSGTVTLSVLVRGKVIWSRFEGLSYQAGVQFADVPAALEQILAAVA